jgi:uncharacterized protein (TIGR02145 family)
MGRFKDPSSGNEVSLIMGDGPGKEAGQNESTYGPRYIPKGWRLPTKADFEELINYAGKTDP